MGFNAIMEEILATERREVLIGIQEGSNTHFQVKRDRKQKAGLNIAQYAAQNEFGTDKIPERSFMRSTFDQRISEIEDVVLEQIGGVIDRDQTLDQAYQRIGQAVQGMIQEKIREIRTPPNSPYTIAMKKSSKPLIDFGQMIAAVRYAIRKAR